MYSTHHCEVIIKGVEINLGRKNLLPDFLRRHSGAHHVSPLHFKQVLLSVGLWVQSDLSKGLPKGYFSHAVRSPWTQVMTNNMLILTKFFLKSFLLLLNGWVWCMILVALINGHRQSSSWSCNVSVSFPSAKLHH